MSNPLTQLSLRNAGEIAFANPSEYAGDHPSIGTILRALETVGHGQ